MANAAFTLTLKQRKHVCNWPSWSGPWELTWTDCSALPLANACCCVHQTSLNLLQGLDLSGASSVNGWEQRQHDGRTWAIWKWGRQQGCQPGVGRPKSTWEMYDKSSLRAVSLQTLTAALGDQQLTWKVGICAPSLWFDNWHTYQNSISNYQNSISN